MSAVGATELYLSGCLPALSSIECEGAALLAKALDCRVGGAAFGKCAACGGYTVGLVLFTCANILVIVG